MRTELFFQPPESIRDVEVRLIPPRRHGSRFQQLTVIQSRKNGNCLRMSPTLLDFCLMLERRRDILCYQPTPYTLIQPSKAFRYTPAVCAYGKDPGLVFFETSRFMFEGDEDRLVGHEDWFGEMGYLFSAIQPCANISYCELLQWRYLYSYSFGVGTQHPSVTLKVLNVNRDSTVQELLDAGADFSEIAYRLFYGEVLADLRFPITRKTRIGLGGLPS